MGGEGPVAALPCPVPWHCGCSREQASPVELPLQCRTQMTPPTGKKGDRLDLVTGASEEGMQGEGGRVHLPKGRRVRGPGAEPGLSQRDVGC